MKIELRPRYVLVWLFFIVLGLYALFQARFLILGPIVSIESHHDGEVVGSPILILSGQGENIAWLSLNGHQIFMNESGSWSEKLLISTGTSIMTVEARDRFGRKTVKSISIIFY